jgi:two-component system, NtrC family, sensor kinase
MIPWGLIFLVLCVFVVGYALMIRAILSRKLKEAEGKMKDAEAQLLQMEKMASLGTLAAGVAHEINNPLSFLISNLENMVDQVGICREKGVQAAHLEDMTAMAKESLEGAQRIKKIVLDLRTFSRKSESKRIALDINQILEFTLSLAWNEIKYKVDIVKDYRATSTVLGDPTELSQVVLNILLNAVQSITDKGTIIFATSEEAGKVVVKISDTGCGIAPEILPRIFDPFFSTKKSPGLGLSVSYNIIKQHKGNLRVESKVNQGTAFFIELPIGGDDETRG